ncbi:MAG: TlpA family protein disulfide reductase, partial [Geothrix sp.]|nr:TlpA family protein disulfide reductase [Geothrix sp.]
RAMLGRRGSAATEAWVKPNEERAFPLAERKSGTTFGFTDVDGKLTTLDALKGKVVVVAFFSTACEPSMRMLVEIAQLQPKGPQYGFELLPMHLESWVNIGQMTRRWAEVKQVRFFRAGLASNGPLQLGPELSALPTVYVLDREGRVAHAYVGFAENRLSAVLRRYLAEKPAAPAPAPKPAGE